MRQTTTLILLGCLALIAGCNLIAYPLYILAPRPPQKTVEPEFAGLPDKIVAVVIAADMDTLYEYPYAREDQTAAIGEQMIGHIEGVRVVSAHRVTRYQDGHVHWNTRPVAEVGAAVGADYVLYISLSEFSTHEPGSVNLPVGRISASTSLWDVHAESTDPDACVWKNSNLSIRVDASTGLLSWNNDALRVQMQRMFADRLVKHFYEHKVPRDSGEPTDDERALPEQIGGIESR